MNFPELPLEPREETREVYICKYCNEPIFYGEECVELDTEHYHSDCACDCAFQLLVEHCGAVQKIAGE